MKRMFDLVVSAAFLVPLSPLFILVGTMIRLESPGPIFYRGVRSGLGGRRFRIYKFRTMVMNADKIGGSSTADTDPRITKLGKQLRKFKLDELPQLINVIKGEMSFVGPRPEVPFYTDLFTEEERAILSVRPGITDWASLWNSDEGALLAGKTDPEKYYLEHIRPEKMRLQLAYVRQRTFCKDLVIMLQTAMTVLWRPLGRKGRLATSLMVKSA